MTTYLVFDEFFSSVNDRDISLGIADCNIPRLEPPIRRDG